MIRWSEPKRGLRNAALLCTLAAASVPAWSQLLPLPPASFSAGVMARSTSFQDGDGHESRGVPINASLDLTGVDRHGLFSQAVVEARTTGGRVPMADVQASAIFALATGSARVSYGFRAVPVDPAVEAPGPIPVFMRVAASVSASVDPANVGDAPAWASFTIDREADVFRNPQLQDVGTSRRGRGIVAIVQEDGSAAAEFDETYRLGLRRGDHSVELIARGSTGFGRVGVAYEFQSVIDPIFWIDPVATFDGPSGPIRFADAYRLEFSEGILPVPEPAAVVLFCVGLALVLVRSTGRFTTRGRPRA